MKENNSRDRILDAAERMFAEHGGEDGVSMRDLAAAADVKLSLLSYYFRGKADLYRAVFERRASELSDARSHALAQTADHAELSLEAVVEAFIRPSVAMRFASDRQGAAFALLTAFEASDPREAERGILAAHYDPTALRFIMALSRLYPEASRQVVVDAYLFMVGALVMTLVSGSRFSRLGAMPENGTATVDAPLITDHLLRFCIGGIRSMLADRT